MFYISKLSFRSFTEMDEIFCGGNRGGRERNRRKVDDDLMRDE